jgi:hypothetical protein
MKRPCVGRIEALSHPLGSRFIDETGGAVTEGAGVPAGVTPDAGRKELLEVTPFFLRRHRLDPPFFGVPVDVLLFFDRLRRKLVEKDGIRVNADRAVILKDFPLFEHFLESRTSHENSVPFFRDLPNLSPGKRSDFPPVDHPFARDADDMKLFPLDLVFDQMDHDVPRIASLGKNTDPLLPTGEVIREIDAAA